MAGQIRVDEITNEAGTGSPSFPNGIAGSELTGSVASTLLSGNIAAARITNALNAGGSAPVYACRAWVNFNGANNTIRASGNVSSVTVNGTGDYRVNFATAMPDANYAIGQSTRWGTLGNMTGSFGVGHMEIARTTDSMQTTSVRLWGTYPTDQVLYNRETFTVSIFR
jgi:hypothetical protein